jgi:hypothetical protein
MPKEKDPKLKRAGVSGSTNLNDYPEAVLKNLLLLQK